jgi:ubiquitin-protein ligase
VARDDAVAVAVAAAASGPGPGLRAICVMAGLGQAAQRRLMKEWREWNAVGEAAHHGLVLRPRADDRLDEWEGWLPGPAGTPYEGTSRMCTSTLPHCHPHARQGLLGRASVCVRLWDPGGRFRLSLQVPYQYPIAAPRVRFLHRVCHPNVNIKAGPAPTVLCTRCPRLTQPYTHGRRAQTGEICVDVLAARWSPAWTLESICLAIQVLLAEPDESSPLNCDAGTPCAPVRGPVCAGQAALACVGPRTARGWWEAWPGACG